MNGFYKKLCVFVVMCCAITMLCSVAMASPRPRVEFDAPSKVKEGETIEVSYTISDGVAPYHMEYIWEIIENDGTTVEMEKRVIEEDSTSGTISIVADGTRVGVRFFVTDAEGVDNGRYQRFDKLVNHT